MDSESKERITLKRIRPNPLFQDWLEKLYDEAKKKSSKLEPMLKEALHSISKYPLPLKNGSECAILKGFDKKLCLFLDRRLDVYNSTKPEPLKQIIIEDNKSTDNTTLPLNRSLNNNLSKHLVASNKCNFKSKEQSDKSYKPKFRSGGYAILLGLLEHLQSNPDDPSLSKNDLIQIAQKHSDMSFTRPKPESFYTAWSGMSKLIMKGLVKKRKSKEFMFSLSDDGITLAKNLIINNNVTTNDLIFNHPSTSTQVTDHNLVTVESAASLVVNKNLSNTEESTQDLSQEQIIFPAGSFEVILLIDKNETSGISKKNDPTVSEFNKYPDLKHEYRSLKVGDFIWIVRHTDNKEELVLPYVVERKRMDDLASSIKDGRFHEQKFRLRKIGLKVVYLVENYGSNKHVGLPMQNLMQALANTRVQDGFKVHITDSLTDSAKFLAIMTKRLTLEYKNQQLKGCNQEPCGHEMMTFQFFNKASLKTKALTVTETFIKLLLQIRGVSVEKALAITKVYETPKLLIDAYKNCDKKKGEILLANLKYRDIDRNVGPCLSKLIYQLFSKESFQ